MRLLVATSNYPHAGHAFSGIFNQRSVDVLRRRVEDVQVLVPRPYAPPMICRMFPRWQAYAAIPFHEVRNGVEVIRPAYLHLPAVGGTFWFEHAAHAASRRFVRRLHDARPFDVVLAFGLGDAGALAWKLGRDLGVLAAGWATGSDVRVAAHSRGGRALSRTLRSLDLVFYQSRELLERAATLLQVDPAALPGARHMVLPRGISAPPHLPRHDTRRRVRAEWGVSEDQVLVLSISRVVRGKGIFELSDAIALAAAGDPRIVCRVVGAMPAFDDTATVVAAIERSAILRGRMQLLPACSPELVWEYLCAADIFAFTSHREGMPNSLLEAMAMGLPAIAFGIPPVRDIAGDTEALAVVAPFDVGSFARTLLRLSASEGERARIGRMGQRRVMEAFSIERSMARAIEAISETAMAHAKHP